MQLWSLHPKYLDKTSLLSLWREGLSAQKSLSVSAANHKQPQLAAFARSSNPAKAIGSYLSFIAAEGARRGYKLMHEKILYPNFEHNFLSVDNQQIIFEMKHLKAKLKIRDKDKLKELSQTNHVELNPIFAAPENISINTAATTIIKDKIDAHRYS